MTLPDIAHEVYGADSAVEYAYAATNVQNCSAGEKAEIIPNNFKEAMTLPAKAQWKAASDKEVASLKKNNVYTLLPMTAVPTGHKIIGSRWVYKVKADNSHKGRVVVLGWGQLPGVDCGSTFAPVCRLQSIRMVLAIAAEYNLECWQLDYNTAFLNADVTEEVYVKMAPGYEEFDENGVPMVMRLLKSLYGLRQSPTNWWNTIDEHLVEIGFKSLKSDPCVYTYSEGGDIIILTLYVDDVLLLGKDLTVLRRIKQKLMSRFSMTDMGDVSLVLGMGVTRDREKGTVTITQENYTKSLLERYGMANCNPAYTPGVGKELSLDQPEEGLLSKEEKQRFQAITGSVMYLGQVTRYDILYAVNQLARAMSKPSKAHMAAAKHLLRYLAGTVDFSITFKQGGFKLTAFSDANWGNNPDNGKSMSSYIVFLSNAPVSFKVGLQGLTAQSTMEAELVAAALAMKEAVFCSNMMKELGFGARFDRVPLHIDNTSALHVAGNRTYSSRVKHVALRYFFIQELVKEGRIGIHYVKTEDQLADIGTKYLSKHRHRYLLKLISEFKA